MFSRTPLDDERIAKGMKTQFGLRTQKLATGEKHIGWKAGFGAPTPLEKLQLEACLVGFMTDAGKVESGGAVSLDGWAKPALEPEVAIYIGADVPAGADAETARAAIAAIGPAIELVDLKPPLSDVEYILSGNIFHRHVVLGEAHSSHAGGDVTGLSAAVSRNGAEAASTDDVVGLTGPLVPIVQRVADTAGAMGETVRKGDVIIAGSIVAPLFLTSEDSEVRYRLGALGEISVAFRR